MGTLTGAPQDLLNTTAEKGCGIQCDLPFSVGFEPWTTCVQASALTISTTETWSIVEPVICYLLVYCINTSVLNLAGEKWA